MRLTRYLGIGGVHDHAAEGTEGGRTDTSLAIGGQAEQQRQEQALLPGLYGAESQYRMGLIAHDAEIAPAMTLTTDAQSRNKLAARKRD